MRGPVLEFGEVVRTDNLYQTGLRGRRRCSVDAEDLEVIV
jgi:hypothetical protein